MGVLSRCHLSCQLMALAGASAQLGSVGCCPHPGSPVRKFPGILAEGLAELLVGGLEVLGQGPGRVAQGSQAQLSLQPLVGTARRRAGMRREGRVRPAGFHRQRRGLREEQEVMATPPQPRFGVHFPFLLSLTPAS